jgi:iron complex transport system substrate-binding protein
LKRFVLALAAAALTATMMAGCVPSPTPTAAPAAAATIVPTIVPTAALPAPTKAAAPASTAAPAAIIPSATALSTLPPAAAQSFPITVTDDAKRQVRIDKAPLKFVSLAPSNTEILFALGLGKGVVGVTDFCDYPAETKAITKIGGMKPNVETIVSLAPDLILTIGGNAELVKRFEDLKLAVIVLDPKDVAAVLKDIELVGRATGSTAASSKLVASMQARMDAVAMRIQAAARPRVFYELDATDVAKPYTAGPGSWHDQLIGMAGGANVAASAKSAWVQFSLEELLKSDPEVVVLGDALFGTTVESARQRAGWSGLTAAKRGAIFPIDDNLVSRPGPRLVDGLEALAKILHPEIFK